MKSVSPGLPIIKIRIRFENDIVSARQKTRKLAELLGFDNQDQARLATAVSELARNAYQYADGGDVEFFFACEERQTFFVCVADQGPGIRDLESILAGSYISKSGMGLGIIGSKRLMDYFDVETSVGDGSRITIGKSLPKSAAVKKPQDLVEMVEKLASRAADSAFEEIQNQNRDLLSALDELNRSKEELAELNRELTETNRGVVALYAELDEKAASLQKANEVKTSFLSNMTHEFRTPLSSIISLTRLLLQNVDGPLTTEQERQVNYIRKSGESLLELVNDLLDLAKVEAGKVTVQPVLFDIDEVLSGLRGVFRPIMSIDSEVDFAVEWNGKEEMIETDQGKLSQILRNLVSNAIKFTERGHVLVSTHCTPAEIHFTIADTGIGIDENHLETIFEDFSQVQSKLQKPQKGTGLGLPLSRKLTTLLGGKLWVESKIGKGSTFHLTIPRKYSGHAEEVLFGRDEFEDRIGQSSQTGAQSSFEVLLIDDDESSRYLLKDLVASEIDAHFTEANSSLNGLEKLKQYRPDLVFLDLAMPEMDGFEFLKTLRADHSLKDIPVIVNTARKLAPDEVQFLTSAAVAILSKERNDYNAAVRDLRRALIKAGFDYKTL